MQGVTSGSTRRCRLTFSVIAVCKTPATSLVPPCAPDAFDQPLPAASAAVLVASLPIVGAGRKTKALDTAVGQADSQNRLGRMHDLSEQIRCERKGAKIFKHPAELPDENSKSLKVEL